jgi:hypothetical protein
MPITMGWVLCQDNDPDGARASFEAALRISRRSGYLFDLAYAGLGQACVAADLGDPRPPGGCQDWCSFRSVAVEVGFEPTEDLRLHTLSRTAHHRSPASVSVRACANTISAATGGRWRTGG